MKTILIDQWLAEPRKPDDPPVFCGTCRDEAHWVSSSSPSCAYCILYESAWSQENAIRIQEYVENVGRKLGRPLLGPDGRVGHDVADRVLFGIVAGSRLAEIWKKQRQ